jgi:ribosome-associated protein YbcJ (S4-like RNA binding protein)
LSGVVLTGVDIKWRLSKAEDIFNGQSGYRRKNNNSTNTRATDGCRVNLT